MTVSAKNLAAGAIVSNTPSITIGKHEDGLPMGLASLWPERFERKPSLHLIGLTWSAEQQTMADQIKSELAEAQARLPLARFVFLLNTPFEAAVFARNRIPCILANNTMFIDERLIRPLLPARPPRFDAVYTARLVPFKRHELAAKIDKLALIYGPPTDAERTRVEQLLPKATFANHPRGAYAYLGEDAVNELLNQASVGLCLSAEEGAMRGAVEYLLAGLPVVSTPSIGGRDRYFVGPHIRIVDETPDAVAAAVEDLKGRAFNRLAIREHVGQLMAFDRHNFMSTVNKLVERVFGVKDRFTSFVPFERFPERWRPVKEIEAGFDAVP